MKRPLQEVSFFHLCLLRLWLSRLWLPKLLLEKVLIQGQITCLAHWQSVQNLGKILSIQMFWSVQLSSCLVTDHSPPGGPLLRAWLTKTQPYSVLTEEQSQAISSLLLACLAWDSVFAHRGHQCLCTCFAAGAPWHSSSGLVIPRRWDAEAQQWWPLPGSGRSGTCVWPVRQHGSAAQGMLPMVPLSALQNPSSWLHCQLSQKAAAQLKFKPNL